MYEDDRVAAVHCDGTPPSATGIRIAPRAFVGFPHLPISVIMSHPCDNDDNYKIAAISNQGSG
jgi:hypothetical protein